ncbi:MAG: hypothetical protein IT215_00200 [Chitinophagaceae bacterium]|nr:hypothetical protein [Chitinophagaceae bacterium]
MNRIYLLFLCLTLSTMTFGQEHAQDQSNTNEILADTIQKRQLINAGRMQLHIMIARLQNKVDVTDGVYDKLIDRDGDINKTTLVSNAIFGVTDKTVAYIENNESDDMLKRKYLGRVIDNLKLFNNDNNDGLIDEKYYASIFEHTYQLIRGFHNHNVVDYVRNHIDKAMFTLAPFVENDNQASVVLMEEMAEQYPEVLIKKIRTIKNEEAANVIVRKSAPKNPKIILNYATSTAIENSIVRRNKDPYVKQIVKISDSATIPLKAIFFIEELNKGKISIQEINKITNDENEYFKKLIALRQEYFTTDLRKIYDRELSHEAARYVTTMNELHDAGDAVRFRIIEKNNATEIYYIIVYGNDDLYTSSFLGCFNRFMQKIKPKSGDEFLNDIGKDKFRSFLRLCANYNTLNPFLASMKDSNRFVLMREFVTGLDNTLEQDLEGATDVANSFGSIKDSAMKKNIEDQISINRDQAQASNNHKAFKIYDVLYSMLTMSSDSLSSKFGIPPITIMPFNQLKDDSDVVVQQVFFFGDKDGQGVFKSFVGGFGAPDWKVQKFEKWYKISSIKGIRIDIYCNIPFDEPEDETAQRALQTYLDTNNIKPSIIIHRGHSYHLPSTLEHINQYHKVVILGACGAYQNLNAVLSQSEDAQIVSTKQIGAGKINGPIIRAFNQRLLAGKDIDWVEMWGQLSKQFSSGETKQLFDDYVPPYKNLGALFLKAYHKIEEDDKL